jgi:uncharacterized membrane protein
MMEGIATRYGRHRFFLLCGILMVAVSANSLSQDKKPVVKAVLFYSPACRHCHQVLSEEMPPLFERYGEQLQVLTLDTLSNKGDELYQAAIRYFHIPLPRRGVPTLIVGTTVLVGSREIPARFPAIIVQGLAEGGIEWPPIPGLDRWGQMRIQPTRIVASDQTTVATNQSLVQRFTRDPLGNGLAVGVLAGMVASILRLGYGFFARSAVRPWSPLTIPLLLPIGLAVAAYLSVLEINQVEAICGPLGDCNTVQQSPYAQVFGIIPVGVLGMVGYLAIAGLWSMQCYGPHRWRHSATLGIFGLALCGTLFSLYLTFLEPFVIGATCLWCLTSAVVMTLLLWAAMAPAKMAWQAS